MLLFTFTNYRRCSKVTNSFGVLKCTAKLIMIFLFLVTYDIYCQAPPPINLTVKNYEKHFELNWERENNPNYKTVVYRSRDNRSYIELGETNGSTYVDYIRDEEQNSNYTYYYTLKTKTENGSLSIASNIVRTNPRFSMTDNEFLDMVQKYTFRYFWQSAHPTSGLIYESSETVASNITTSGGTGFGLMTIPVGIERNFINRQEGRSRVLKIVNFLTNNTTRFHGAWSHWINGNTGAVIPFSATDDGADLVETSFLIQGLLTVKEYFNENTPEEIEIRDKIQTLWEGVEWDWFIIKDKDGNPSYLNWHWSPNHGSGNLSIQGWNEALITYVLAISSPTHPVPASLYDTGWARNGNFVSNNKYKNINLPLGHNSGGPLFLTHYSFLGLDPTRIGDLYMDSNYYEQGKSQTLINRAYCMDNPGKYLGYGRNFWGITASQSPDPDGYKAHEPDLSINDDEIGKLVYTSSNRDNGTIAPTASISSIVYTPEESIEALKSLYRQYGDRLWGNMGFKDAINPEKDWASSAYLAIDQGPIILMIENYRSKLLWKNFMKNRDIINGLNSIGSIILSDNDYQMTEANTIKIYINGKEKLKILPSNNNTLIPINAVIGDELMIEVYNTDAVPVIKGLPDLWVARAFINEGIFMSSKSITPGAYKPWIPFSTVSHTTLVLPYSRNWITGQYESSRYPEWKKEGNLYRLKWTLKRSMGNVTYNGNKIDYKSKYPDENVPWWKTWDTNGNPIVDGTGKFNAFGSVPYGTRRTINGTYPQRQGKNTGMDMLTLHALKGDIKTAYGQNTNLRDNNPYYVKSDGDDTYTNEFKDLSTKPFNVVTPTAQLRRPFVELWKVVPDGEMNNPVSEIVTWYQKAINENNNTPLPSSYTYDGYEVWEDKNENPISRAPEKVELNIGNNTTNIGFSLQVDSPIEGDKFYNLYKENDNDNKRDILVSTNDLTIGIDNPIKANLVQQMKNNGSKFDIVLGHSTWIPRYEILPLALDNDGTLSGEKNFKIGDIRPGPALHAFLSYRRTPASEPVIISGIDFWLSSNIEAMRCEEYRNLSESRTLRKSDFAINDLSDDNYIDVQKYTNNGYNLSRINEEYTILKGESLTFRIWDNVDFGFNQIDTKWYMSSRKRKDQLSEADGAKRVKIKLYKVANNGKIMETQTLQDLNTGTSLTHKYTFNTPGNYIYESSLDRKGSEYQVFVRVLEGNDYKTDQEGRVKVRYLLPEEIKYLNKVLPDDKKIKNEKTYRLAMISDVKASYAWAEPKAGGGPRSFMNSDKTVRYHDRFAPFNDYADEYKFDINNSGVKKSEQLEIIKSYLSTKESSWKLLPGYWVNHLDPLGESESSYGVQDEFNLGSRISDIDPSFIADIFADVQNKADSYTVDFNGKRINSRNPRPWEVRLPWSSLSKYHGFRLRTAPKSPVNAVELEKAIVNVARSPIEYFELPFLGSGFSGTGVSKNVASESEATTTGAPPTTESTTTVTSTTTGTTTTTEGVTTTAPTTPASNKLINPILKVKTGFMDTDEEKLEYQFFLNLKHNRWVLIEDTTQNVTFYNSSDPDNLIASDFIIDPSYLSGLIPINIPSNLYYVLDDQNHCLITKDNRLSFHDFVKDNNGWGKCEKITISEPSTDITKRSADYSFIAKIGDKYIEIGQDSSLKQIENEAKLMAYKTNSSSKTLNEISFSSIGLVQNFTKSKYNLINISSSAPNTSYGDSQVAQSLDHNNLIKSIGIGVGTAAGVGIGGYGVYKIGEKIKNTYTRLPNEDAEEESIEMQNITKKCQ